MVTPDRVLRAVVIALTIAFLAFGIWVVGTTLVKSPADKYWECMKDLYVTVPVIGEEESDFRSDDVVCRIPENSGYTGGTFTEWNQRRQSWPAVAE